MNIVRVLIVKKVLIEERSRRERNRNVWLGQKSSLYMKDPVIKFSDPVRVALDPCARVFATAKACTRS